ncbi:MAG TPA: hypothetical protein VFG64_10475 [Dongiaceae bacterium]|nr:hypothetical protein [Dongiaceae bacterium]
MRHVAPLALLLTMTALPALADPIVDEKSTTETTVTMDGDAYLIHTVNRRHEVASFFDDRAGEGAMKRYLVETEIDRSTRESDEEEIDVQSSVLHVVARPLAPKGLGPDALTMQTNADEVAVDGPYVVATRWGCCAEQSSHEVFSLYTGKRLFSATGEGDSGQWLTMGKKGPNYDQRLVAAHLAFTPRDDEELGQDQSVVGIIAYATEAEPLQRLALRAPGGREGDLPTEWLPKLIWITPREPDGVDHAFFEQVGDARDVYTGITLRLQLDDETNIDIPLVADRLVPGQAKLPDGYSLSEVKVE